MLILSSFDNDKKFIEIIDVNECQNIESDCYVYISIDSTSQSDLEKYFQIGKFLNQNEVQYAVLLNDITSYYISRRIYKYKKMREDTAKRLKYEEYDSSFIGGCKLRHKWDYDRLDKDSLYEKEDLVSFNEEVSLQFILSMFARYGASFFIFDENNYDLLPLAQSYANYHLFDMKILGLVSSYMQSGFISSWDNTHSVDNGYVRFDKVIHIDGVIEKSLLVKHKTKQNIQ